MTDRGDDDLFGPDPDGGDELWRPTRPGEPGGTGADVPPIAEQTDPAGPTPTSEPTRMMDPLGASGPEPTRVGPPVPPAGPFGPGGPYGGPGGAGGGPGGPDDPDHPFAEDDAPVPWYRQPGPLAALIAGLVAIVLAVLALILMNDGDDEITTGSTSSTTSTTLAPTTLPVVLPPTVPPAPAPTETAVPATTTTSTTLAPTTTSTSTTTSSTTTTTTTTSTTTTTTTLPPTTTTAASTTTTSTTLPPVPPASPWVVIQDNPSLTLLEGYIEEAGLQSQFEAEDITVLAPDDVSFQQLSAQPGGAALLADEAMLTELLLRHVVVEPLTSAVIFTRSELETVAESGPVAVDVAGRRIEGAAIIAANIEAGESYLQVIDRVLVGPLLEG